MKPIVTLTLNPAIDGAAETDRVRPTHKIRTTNERYYPGGGGINVARVVAGLGGPTLPVYLRGGATGAILDQFLEEAGFNFVSVPIEGNTRISHTVYERSTGQEFRFVPEGSPVTIEDWARCREAIEALEFDWLVASGSLPQGLDGGCFAELAALCAARGARFVVDTSGQPLEDAVAGGGVWLVKPSLGEFQALTGRTLETNEEIAAGAQAFCRDHGIGLVAVTMGHDGALLAGPDGWEHLHPPEVPVQSATGAGDSFLGALVLALAQGRPRSEAFRFATAAGTAAVLTPGTELCRREDVERLYDLLGSG